MGIGKGTDWSMGLLRPAIHQEPHRAKGNRGNGASTTNGCVITTWAGDHQMDSTQGFVDSSESNGQALRDMNDVTDIHPGFVELKDGNMMKFRMQAKTIFFASRAKP